MVDFVAEGYASKPGIADVYPVNARYDSYGVLEPLVTAPILRQRHLFGIPLVSFAVDPITQKRQVMTDDIIEDRIKSAVGVAEIELGMDIMPKVRRDKFPFDRPAYQALGYMVLPRRPVISLEKIAVTSSDGTNLYTLPPQWIETAYIHTGQINIIPINIGFQYGAMTTATQGGNPGGLFFLAILGQNHWIPAYWMADYTTGFPDGKMPIVVNELVGIIAAIDILALLATTNARNSSHSIGVDGLSQSISTPGPQIYDTRITMLMERKQTLINKLKVMYGQKLFSGVI
jgi:hypothetical protein